MNPHQVAEAFCALLESRLRYAEGERDAVLMEHTVGVRYADGRPEQASARPIHAYLTATCAKAAPTHLPKQTLSSSLVGFGEPAGASAMSRSVGLTAAVGVHRVLEQPSGPLPPLAGVVRPTERSVWEYCLPPLEKEGLRFQETVL